MYEVHESLLWVFPIPPCWETNPGWPGTRRGFLSASSPDGFAASYKGAKGYTSVVFLCHAPRALQW